jgi:hypothetical protein
MICLKLIKIPGNKHLTKKSRQNKFLAQPPQTPRLRSPNVLFESYVYSIENYSCICHILFFEWLLLYSDYKNIIS